MCVRIVGWRYENLARLARYGGPIFGHYRLVIYQLHFVLLQHHSLKAVATHHISFSHLFVKAPYD